MLSGFGNAPCHMFFSTSEVYKNTVYMLKVVGIRITFVPRKKSRSICWYTLFFFFCSAHPPSEANQPATYFFVDGNVRSCLPATHFLLLSHMFRKYTPPFFHIFLRGCGVLSFLQSFFSEKFIEQNWCEDMLLTVLLLRRKQGRMIMVVLSLSLGSPETGFLLFCLLYSL